MKAKKESPQNLVDAMNQDFQIVGYSASFSARNTIVIDDAAVSVNGVVVGIIKRMYLHMDAMRKAYE